MWVCPDCKLPNPPTAEQCGRCEFAVTHVFQEALDAMAVDEYARLENVRIRRDARIGADGEGRSNQRTINTAKGHTTKLTPTQLRVLQLASMGLENAEIATALGLSMDTVRTHLKAVTIRMTDAGLVSSGNRAGLCCEALRQGWIE